jgi:hypothetical protein
MANTHYKAIPVKIDATYQNGCFCERPTLEQGKPFRTSPRFEFKKEARRYAEEHGMVIDTFFKGADSAIAQLSFPCKHTPVQYVRLSWTLA